MSFLAGYNPGGRSWPAAGGAFGAPGDIRSADPRFTLSRAPAFANRPSSLILRSDDALQPGVEPPVVQPASFLLNLPAPVIGAKAMGVRQAVVKNVLPTVPDYQRWFIWQVTVASTGATRTFVARYLQGVAQPLPIVNSLQEWVPLLNQTVQPYAPAGVLLGGPVEVPPGQKVSLAWYLANLGAGMPDADLLPIFAADLTAQKIAIELPVASGAPYGPTDVLILPGMNVVREIFDSGALAAVSTVTRYDLLLNQLIGQPAQPAPWVYTAPRSPGAALVLPICANINGTQTIYVTSNLTQNGGKTVTNTARSIIATMPVNVKPNVNITFNPSVIHWIWSVANESIMQVTVDLLDENLQPINFPFNGLTEIEVAFLYEDSTL
jgi:hypothetical protein